MNFPYGYATHFLNNKTELIKYTRKEREIDV